MTIAPSLTWISTSSLQFCLFDHWLRQPYAAGVSNLYELSFHLVTPFSNYIIHTVAISVKMPHCLIQNLYETKLLPHLKIYTN